MANKKAPIDFQALLDEVNADFPVYQALDQDGNVVNKDLVPHLTDDELVELMTPRLFCTNCWTRGKSAG